jgi:GntR family transcriptional repressor for pyruvate dehydrogenase complex
VTATRRRTHEAVLEHVHDQLEGGGLRPGDRLPPERELSAQLGVSRPSVREGIRVLEAMGVVRSAAGSGPVAGTVMVADASAGITAALRLHLAARTLPVHDIVTTRLLLETWAVSSAAAARNRDQLDRATELLDRMDQPELSPVEFHRLDAEFHVTLAEAAGNEVVSAIMTSLRDSIQGYVLAAVPQLKDWAATSRRLRREHRRILDAVTDRDGDLAASLVRGHIQTYYREVQLGRSAPETSVAAGRRR